jgi:hypothetical protein
MNPTNLSLSLTRDEALVLLELLARGGDHEALQLEHHAERMVLWRLEGLLEQALVEVLRADYRTAVATARTNVAGTAGSDEPDRG